MMNYDVIIKFVGEFWKVLGEMSPYLLFGFLVAGILSAWVPADLIERHLGGRGFWPTLRASLLGIPLPICSCGVIPVAVGLRRHGASRGATTSFLLSTPQTGVDSILVTLGMLGPLYAVYRPIAALITGVAGGVIVDAVDRRYGEPEAADAPAGGASCTDSCCTGDSKPAPKAIQALHYGFITLPKDIGKSLLIGLVIAALISSIFVDGELSGKLSGIWAMLAVMVVSIPMYICATSSVPLAAAMIMAGLSPGAALVMLVAGPATNAASLTTLWKVLGPRATLTYLGTVAVGALLGGLLLDKLFVVTGMSAHMAEMFMLPTWFNSVCAVALIVMVTYAMWPRTSKPVPAIVQQSGEELAVLKIDGMSCGSCVAHVERALLSQVGVSGVQVDLAGGTATITGNGFSLSALLSAVTSAGYDASNVAD